MKCPLIITALGSLLAMCACNDDSTTIGSTLVDDVMTSEIVVDSTFSVTGRTVDNPVVQSRTLTQLIGRLDAKEYGSIESDFVCQFMPSMNLDTAGVTAADVDSCKLIMFMTTNDFTGDSIVPMGLEVYKLNKALPSPIYSNFSPDGYYSTADKLGETIYTANALWNDSVNQLSFRSVQVDLPKSLATDLFTHFEQVPEDFTTPAAFTSWFPGIYVTNTFGSGRVMNITETRINVYYRKKMQVTVNDVEKDTIYNLVRSYMAVTPEVITNNNIDLTISPEIRGMINSGDNILIAPAGTEVELTFPLADILASYRRGASKLSVLNNVSFEIPAEEIANDYNIEVPQHVLMVLKNKKSEFFEENKIADSGTSFMATYDATKKSYTFSEMRQYILDMLEKSTVTADDWTFILTPVNLETETTSSSYYTSGTTYITNVSPYVTKPAMVKISLDKAKIKMTYSKQSQK
ncbi:DUF4270 family protein [Paramuribaculum intestinale]|uniref:DUF4270 family protein n=1 Tax=Paramuribaculum intestinale TaxID=2094151 RepID=UPI0025B231D4|nr:DUF4270 family protein [Paramuribaculum intestinale]